MPTATTAAAGSFASQDAVIAVGSALSVAVQAIVPVSIETATTLFGFLSAM